MARATATLPPESVVEAEINRPVLRKATVERDIEQAGLAADIGFRNIAEAAPTVFRRAPTMRMRPARSVTSMRPSGRKASDQGCTRPPATVSTLRFPAEEVNTGCAGAIDGASSRAKASSGAVRFMRVMLPQTRGDGE